MFDTGPIVVAAFTTEDYYQVSTELFAGLRLANRRLLLPATVSAEAGYLIATIDRRHFTTVRPRHVEAFTLLPERL